MGSFWLQQLIKLYQLQNYSLVMSEPFVLVRHIKCSLLNYRLPGQKQ